MVYNFNFSCTDTTIDPTLFKDKGYQARKYPYSRLNPNIYHDISNLVITHINPCDNTIINRFDYWGNIDITPDNQIHIPLQKDGYFQSNTHPGNDEYVFLQLNGLTVRNITIVIDGVSYKYQDERELVCDLMLERIDSIEPFTSPWRTFYEQVKPVSISFMKSINIQAEQQMNALINASLVKKN